MARPEYCRFLVGKWRSRTLGMTLEQEGLLIRISAFNMDAGVAMPACRTTTARMVGCHRNKLDKLLAALITLGEIVEDATGIYSARALAEYKRSTREMSRNQTPEQPHTYPEDTPEIPQAYPEATPPVEAEKSEQLLRARRGEERRGEEIGCESAREGEAHAGHGVFVNCETIRHREFSISLPGIEMGALGAGKSKDEIKSFCLGHALQWAAEIEGGKPARSVVPDKIANFLSRSLMGAVGQKASQEVRMDRAKAGPAKTVSFAEERIARAKAFQAKLKLPEART